MATRILPSQTYLRECFDYDPVTGILRWRVRPPHHFVDEHAQLAWNGRYAGTTTGTSNRYLTVSINKTLYRAHRIIWKWMTGNDPVNEIDHLDTNKLNNTWTNLRDATHTQNRFNQGPKRTSRLGVKGVWYDRNKRRYTAEIHIAGQKIFLGRFTSLEEAKSAYDQKAEELHGEFWHE